MQSQHTILDTAPQGGSPPGLRLPLDLDRPLKSLAILAFYWIREPCKPLILLEKLFLKKITLGGTLDYMQRDKEKAPTWRPLRSV